MIKEIQAEQNEEKAKLQNFLIQSSSIRKNNEYEIMMGNIGMTKKHISDLETEEIEAWDVFEKAK